MNKAIIIICIALCWFLLLYLIAFLANRHYRNDEDVLWISKNQWGAIFTLWVPFLIGIALGVMR